MKKKSLALIVVFSLMNTIVFAQTKPPASIVLIKAGRLIDVRSGRVIENQGILVEGERIKAVGPMSWERLSRESLRILSPLPEIHCATLRNWNECDS